MNIVYFHTEDAQERFPEAWKAFDRLTAISPAFFHRELTTKADDYSYWSALNKWWGRSPLLMVEQDVIIDADMIWEMFRCPEECCTRYFTNSSLYLKDTLSVGARINDPEHEILFPTSWRGQVPTYVTFSGVGFCKFSGRLQQKPLERFAVKTRANGMSGLNADNAIIQNINSWLDGFLKFHVHGEVKHLHDSPVRGAA